MAMGCFWPRATIDIFYCCSGSTTYLEYDKYYDWKLTSKHQYTSGRVCNKLYTNTNTQTTNNYKNLFVWLYDGSICLPRKHQKFRNYLQLKGQTKNSKRKSSYKTSKSDAAYMTQKEIRLTNTNYR